MDVRVRINGRIFLLSMDEFMKLVLGMTPANPVDVLDFVGKLRGERHRCRSPHVKTTLCSKKRLKIGLMRVYVMSIPILSYIFALGTELFEFQ